ncbi:MAG TPA: ABC transporter ATP-binding protein [Gammaproteobacteria bacterium]|nr:ABC transporter ATP-binding protein [Gammaproteobacteria bacterium]
MLTISQLSLKYGTIPALHDISLEVADNEIVTLLGSNGAGKTSTLRAISGLVRYQGIIKYQNQDLADIPSHKRINLGIAHVPEGRGIFSDLTVIENLRLAGWGVRNLDFNAVYKLFPQLRERHKQAAGTLSGGEQQMLAIARALLRKPKLLLLDEPSMGLSPKLMLEVFAALKKIHAEGVGILLVEQNAHLALNLAQRAYVLENGRIALSGNAAVLMKDSRIKELYLGG